MHPSVSQNFASVTEPLEGKVTKPYPDSLNLVTTGLGYLIDSSPRNSTLADFPDGYQGTDFLNLDWRRDSDGGKASVDEMIDAWRQAKGWRENGQNGGRLSQGSIHLTDSEIQRTTAKRLNDFADKLRENGFPSFDSWPADAQLGILSMAWALGPAFGRTYKNFTEAANSMIPDFQRMAQESHITGGGTIVQRNAMNQTLFNNAAEVLRSKADSARLYFPDAVTARRLGIGIGGLFGVALLAGGGYAGYRYGYPYVKAQVSKFGWLGEKKK